MLESFERLPVVSMECGQIFKALWFKTTLDLARSPTGSWLHRFHSRAVFSDVCFFPLSQQKFITLQGEENLEQRQDYRTEFFAVN